MVYVFLANGFEEIEALTPIDILRRADIPVCIVGVGTDTPCGSHGICIKADCVSQDIRLEDMVGIILPGGMPGTIHLEQSPAVQDAIDYAMSHDLVIAAICAAPSILGHRGDLYGRRAVCFPGFEESLIGATVVDEMVVVDHQIITARGAGVALDFALTVVAALRTPQIAEEIRGIIQCP